VDKRVIPAVAVHSLSLFVHFLYDILSCFHAYAPFPIPHAAGDVLPDLRTPLLDITNKKLADPAFQCCTLHSAEECELERLAKEQEMQSQMGGFDFGRWAAEGEESNSNGCLLGRNDNAVVTLVMMSLHAAVIALAVLVL
jgi:hypothetical protein